MSAKEIHQSNTTEASDFPPMLALQIVRKAAALAGEFEDAALTKLTTDARTALKYGMHPKEVARVLKLT